MLSCYNHANRVAAGMCVICKKVFCTDCLVEVGGKCYCKEHVAKLFAQQQLTIDKLQHPSDEEPQNEQDQQQIAEEAQKTYTEYVPDPDPDPELRYIDYVIFAIFGFVLIGFIFAYVFAFVLNR